MGLLGNYAPVDFHHRLMACPSYSKKRDAFIPLSLPLTVPFVYSPCLRR